MRVSARVQNTGGNHQVTIQTGEDARTLTIPPKASGFGSSASGGELLFLALATCYCNDVYREAAKRHIVVRSVEVEVQGDFEAEGEPAKSITYQARVVARGSEEQIQVLMQYVDSIAEIHNTLRVETPVVLSHIEVESVRS